MCVFNLQDFSRLMQTRCVFFFMVPQAPSLHGEGSCLQVCRANIVTVHKAAAFQLFWLCLCEDRVSNLPQVAVVIQVVLVSYIVVQILLKETSWLFNTDFDINCSTENGRTLARIIYS